MSERFEHFKLDGVTARECPFFRPHESNSCSNHQEMVFGFGYFLMSVFVSVTCLGAEHP